MTVGAVYSWCVAGGVAFWLGVAWLIEQGLS